MTDKKPRIAFCFSGQARTLDQTYIFFQKNLFDAAEEQGFDYDVFCAVEDDEDVDKVKLLNPSEVEKFKSSEVEKIIEDRYGNLFRNSKEINKFCYLFNQEYFFLGGEKMIYNFLQQIYKVSKSFQICKGYQRTYDIVFRLRFDTFFLNSLNFSKIQNYIETNKTVLCNSWEFMKYKSIKHFYQIEDLFFIGNDYLMNSLGKFFDDFINSLDGEQVRQMIIFKIFSCIRTNIIKINDLLKHRIIPLYPILYLESFFYKIFSPELCYLNFLEKEGLHIENYKFSHILLRKEWSLSYIKVENKKNLFEL